MIAMRHFPIFLLLAGSAIAAEIKPEAQEFFEKKIRPVLAAECYECHGPTKRKAGLRLDYRDGLLEGGDTGPAVVAGDVEKSLLIQSIKHLQDDLKMPKNGAKLDSGIVADFEKWVRMGAPDPRDKALTAAEASKDMDWNQVVKLRKQWWSFQPVTNPGPPEVKNAAWSPHPVDRFVLKKMEDAGLEPVKRADAATLIRRINYLVTGLPPSPAEVVAFEQSAIQNPQSAIETLVDRLLKSPRFGETWARHWMDWVRYAESYGSEGDPAIPYAWRYRDYLIRAFNADVPYPQLVREAIAGDLLPKPRLNKDVGVNESALGIAQLRMVQHGFSPVDTLDEMVTFTDNQIDVVSKAFQGLTLTCARCHNHKFDAISQADYYAMFGIFGSTHPAVVDASLPNAGKAKRDELKALKGKIKVAVGKAWLTAVDQQPSADAPQKAQLAAADPLELKRWDLRKDKWFADGDGIMQGATKAGEFAVANDGDKIVSRIHPSGIFSDLISTKERAVLNSPRFKCEGGTLWIRANGAGGARARYIVDNYPRTGTIHKAKEFKEAGEETLGWHKLDLEFWKGDEIFIQATTAADMPVETKQDERSWFGITDVVITKGSDTPPTSKPGGNPRAAVEAWLNNTMTDEQAELIDALLHTGKLPNDAAKLPAAAPLIAKYREIEASLPQPMRSPGVLEADGADQALFVRGNHKQPAEIIPRRFFEALDAKPYQPKDSGRLELAASLTHKDNPLTSRVIVNRLWHHVFGRGIVATTDNFGRLGTEPTHPELLDYLASRFDKEGGSIKAMLHLLITSQTFQLDHHGSPKAAESDPENLLLSHASVRRLEAEAIRDSILSRSGKMTEEMYGSPVGGKEPRRSVYVKVIRNNLDPLLTVFDMPVPSSTRGRRDATNVPAQSLSLLNDPAIIQWSGDWAKRILAADAKSDEDRVALMFAEAFGRKPSADEAKQSAAYLRALTDGSEEAKDELARAESKAAGLQQRIETLLTPARRKLSKPDVAGEIARLTPTPLAEWDFKKGPRDLRGGMNLELEGNARIEGGALLLDGGKSCAVSAPLPKTLHEKTLEAWVQLADLDQRGGGVVTVQTKNGGIFDSIVFGEKDPRCWISGSNNFKRTESFTAPNEDIADKRPVHLAIVYKADGTITAYRQGQPYGQAYSKELMPFEAGDCNIVLGMRHSPGGGNKMLRGRILRARVYDRALSAEEVQTSSKLEASAPSDDDVLAALSQTDRDAVKRTREELEPLQTQITDLRAATSNVGPEAAWRSLAQSLVNLKEFIYLR
jgi:ssDNA-binding Zn-finger/Zn-ribbon topoisomerase 1